MGRACSTKGKEEIILPNTSKHRTSQDDKYTGYWRENQKYRDHYEGKTQVGG
jgi:hypothetical protein